MTTMIKEQKNSNKNKALQLIKEKGTLSNKLENWKYTDIKNLETQTIVYKDEKVRPNEELEGVHFSEVKESDILSVGVDSNPKTYDNTVNYKSSLKIESEAHNISTKPIELSKLPDRMLVRVKENGSLTIFVNLNQVNEFSNRVIEIELEDNASLNWVQIEEDTKAPVFNSSYIKVGENCTLKRTTLVKNGVETRHDTQVEITGENNNLQLNGLAILNSSSKLYNHLVLNHRKGNSVAKQEFKTILDDQAVSEFSGLVRVFPGSHNTDSQQQNHNLLLSDSARALSRPQLEIDADDVDCSHGSTIGQLNPDEVFYCKTRGLSDLESRDLLLRGFGEEIIQKIENSNLKKLSTKIMLDGVN